MNSLVDINLAICKMIGLDTTDVFSVTIELSTDALPIVTAKKHLTEVNEDGELIEVLKKFQLSPIEDGDDDMNEVEDPIGTQGDLGND